MVRLHGAGDGRLEPKALTCTDRTSWLRRTPHSPVSGGSPRLPFRDDAAWHGPFASDGVRRPSAAGAGVPALQVRRGDDQARLTGLNLPLEHGDLVAHDQYPGILGAVRAVRAGDQGRS
jgi:hypothetical protein